MRKNKNIERQLKDIDNSLCIQNMQIKKKTSSNNICTYSRFYDDHIFRVWSFYKPITKPFIILVMMICFKLNAQISQNPYQVASETQFDYSAYLKLLQMDTIFIESQWERSYIELLSVLESRYGKYIESVSKMDAYFEKSQWTLHNFPYVKLVPMNECLDSLIATNRITMINETHFDPVYRSVAHCFLSICYKQGYRYLAVETLKTTDTLLNKRKYPLLYETGFYSDEPLYGDFLRQAMKMGFTLVPYDDFPQDGTSRDEAQALNIINRTLKKDKKAKVLVFGGMGHIFDKKGFHTMGWYFKEHSKIDPLTINFVYFPSRYSREQEGEAQRVFLDIADSFSIEKPLFLYDTINEMYKGIGTDIIAIIPRTKFIHQTIPSWKMNNDKIIYQIDRDFIELYGFEKGLLGAYLFSEKGKGVPIDQIEYKKTDKEVFLVLYPEKYLFQFDDGENKKTMVVKIKKK